MYDQNTVDRVQQSNNIIDVVGEYVNLVKRGRELAGVCPFHDDHRPSMYVSEAKQIFKCFACSAGGDVFKFVQMREQLTFPQAIERLAERAGITLEKTRLSARAPRDPDQPDPNELARVNDWARRFFEANLADAAKGAEAREYVGSRHLSPESTQKWHVGLALGTGTDLAVAAQQRQIPRKILEAAGLITPHGQDKFANRLMFTISDVTGRTIGFGGRTLANDRAKYVNSPTTTLFNKSHCLYGLNQAKHAMGKTGVAVVVEGYTDCIMAHQFGCDNVVATLGTSFTDGHGRILRRYAKTVVLIFDGDTAGIEAANRGLDVCLKHRIDIKVASVPPKMDPCDFILAHGKERFDDLVANATDVFEFKWSRLYEQFQADTTLSGQKAAIDAFLQTVATAIAAGNVSAIDRGLIINRLSKLVGMDTRQITAELSRRLKTTPNAQQQILSEQGGGASTQLGEGLRAVAQREIIEVLLNEPKLFTKIREEISVESFDIPILKQVAGILFNLFQENENGSGAEVLARVESVELAQCVAELMATGERKGNYQARVEGALDILRGDNRKGHNLGMVD